jgi:hypothetical protein
VSVVGADIKKNKRTTVENKKILFIKVKEP